ncbi:MAG: response regulator transcription factor [Chloroflexota bacterium]|nr:response regulator transcription factor [Chloroflexota bacterium]
MRLLLVEDEARLAEVIRRGLVENAYAVDVAGTAADALELAVASDYDLIILDRRLPDGDGAQVTAELRRSGLRTPILLLTARDAVEDRVEGLDLGADDYLVKPFAFPELTARVRALVRREMPEREPILRAGQIAIDPASHTATYAGKPIRLAPREFAVLEYLLRRKGDVVTRTAIEEHSWDGGFDSLSNVVDVYVARLRRLTGGRRSPIETVRGVGYRMRAV